MTFPGILVSGVGVGLKSLSHSPKFFLVPFPSSLACFSVFSSPLVRFLILSLRREMKFEVCFLINFLIFVMFQGRILNFHFELSVSILGEIKLKLH